MSGVVVWLTGPPSSGKSSLAERVRQALSASGRAHCVLDGDAVRAALVPRPGYEPAGRADFYETLARLAGLLAGQGLVVLVPATAHRRAFRDRARALAPRFVEVSLESPPAACAARDAKGLYAAARAGEVSELPGADVAYEPPTDPDVRASGGEDEGAVTQILKALQEGAGPARRGG
jgi:adenylylsulfate kinase